MNKLNRHLLLIALLMLFAISGRAQSIAVKVPPTSYVDISRIGLDMFRVTDKKGKVGIVSGDGTIIAPVECDNITPFYQGWALLLSGKEVKGCISADGHYNRFDKKYIAIDRQMFFSEGLLTVINGRKEFAYINTRGDEVIVMSKNYTSITPFSEGYATVFTEENKRSCLIDRSGKELVPETQAGMTLIRTTNVYNGVAYMWDENGNYFKYFIKEHKCESSSRPEGERPDYLYRPTDKGSVLPYDKEYKGMISRGVMPVEENGLTGYKNTQTGGMLLPCQLRYAEQFIDDLAIVKLENGNCAILRYYPTDAGGFSVAVDGAPVQHGDLAMCRFTVRTPASWRPDEVDVNVTSRDKSFAVSNDDNGHFSFRCNNNGSSKRTFDVSLMSQGLLWYTTTLSYTFAQKSPVSSDSSKSESKVAANESKNVTPKHAQDKIMKDEKKEQEKKVQQEKKKREEEKKEQEKKKKEEEKKKQQEKKKEEEKKKQQEKKKEEESKKGIKQGKRH